MVDGDGRWGTDADGDGSPPDASDLRARSRTTSGTSRSRLSLWSVSQDGTSTSYDGSTRSTKMRFVLAFLNSYAHSN